ncbi:MAG: condensation domain-containing protein [Candidatus Limivicinus sp.]
MIKINGNRIEPAEIEAAVKQCLNIDWCAARGFEDGEKSFLCAYYTADVDFDPNELREELMKRLPYYMIPAYFMKIDEVPLKANGKLDRKALPEPDASDFQNSYVPPENDTQRAVCEAMAAALKLNRVGIHDDFYEMGGDSLASIEFVTRCALAGLNTTMIFRGRTPEKIAQLYEQARSTDDGESADEKNARALQEEHPLTAEQLYMVDYQLYTPDSTMYNLYTMLKVDTDLIDLHQLMEAVDTAIHNHPALLTTFHFKKDGTIVQRYSPESARELYMEKLTDWEFRNAMKDTLVQPFQVIGGTLYRCRFFQTEKAGYVFFDVHHTLSDGTSMKVFMADIFNAFMGEKLEKDYYYLVLRRREEAAHTEFYEESRRYFEEHYDGVDWSTHPNIDHESRDNEMGEMSAPLGIMQPQMNAMERAYKISRNEFFITVAGLAVSIYNNAPNVKLSWIYNGREDMETMNTVGLLFRDLPVAFRFRDNVTLRDLFADVHEQVRQGIEHSCYPYVDLHNQVGKSESAYLLYQQDIRDMGEAADFNIETVDIRQNQAASQTILDMEVLDGSDGLQLMIDFAASRYQEESIERFRDLFVKIAQALVTHNSQSDVTVREIREKVSDRKSFFRTVQGIFSRKR